MNTVITIGAWFGAAILGANAIAALHKNGRTDKTAGDVVTTLAASAIMASTAACIVLRLLAVVLLLGALPLPHQGLVS